MNLKKLIAIILIALTTFILIFIFALFRKMDVRSPELPPTG
ncbi:MAG: hypothetical protein OEU84_05705 [Xanthomonadales bacterium]|nr:hypothetical protein [Xanthomonadales bacterium]